MFLSFAFPWLLLALLLLPILWWLLRQTPPKPHKQIFPPTKLLLEISQKDQTPQHSPWWLTLLRLLLASAIIFFAAGPSWQTEPDPIQVTENTLLIVDNDVATAVDWPQRQKILAELTADASKNDALIAFVPSVFSAAEVRLFSPLLSPNLINKQLEALTPYPHKSDRKRLAERLAQMVDDPAFANIKNIIWLSNGLKTEFDGEVASVIGSTGLPLSIITSPPQLFALERPQNNGDELSVSVKRSGNIEETNIQIKAFDFLNRPMGQVDAKFNQGEKATKARFKLPLELRNQIVSLRISQGKTALSTRLLDDSFRRKTIGLLAAENAEIDQPLLAPSYFIHRALAPFAEIRLPRTPNIEESIDGFLQQNVAAIFMADVGILSQQSRDRLEAFLQKGGLVVRFAGPRLAASEDDFVPVKLRSGGRILGGSLSWLEPQKISSFAPDSPFSQIELTDEIRAETTVRRQVLAEPSIAVSERSWAILEDGTPLVTAKQAGSGWLVLFHIPSDTAWSDLPLSGLFVDMLKSLLPLAQNVDGSLNNDPARESDANANLLPPLKMLSASGEFIAPSPAILALDSSTPRQPDVAHPIGLYGNKESFQALNDADEVILEPLEITLYEGADIRPLTVNPAQDLRLPILLIAFVLLLLDSLAVLFLNGLLKRRKFTKASVSAIIIGFSFFSLHGQFAEAQSEAQTNETDIQRAIEDANTTRFAYVLTGSKQVDDLSQFGLSGLSQFIASRTSLEPGYPRGIDPEKDELSLYAFIYWPIDPATETPSEAAMARVDSFMKQGGTVIFDTKDQLNSGSDIGRGISPANQKLREILSSLDVPALQVVDGAHVLTRSFYLLQHFPGRFTGSPLWTENWRDGSSNLGSSKRLTDGVSSILITANDFAGAWALSPDGRPLLPTVPANPRQRELAFRVGVNIAMYALTGNYKADQVHLPTLIERLGQ